MGSMHLIFGPYVRPNGACLSRLLHIVDYLLMLVQRQTPSVQVFNRVGSGMLSFQYIFLSTNIICPIVVSYFTVSVLASMHACAVCS